METLLDYLNSHIKTPINRTDNRPMLGRVVKPLPIFKVVGGYVDSRHRNGEKDFAIASLLVPKGAYFYIGIISIKRLHSKKFGVYGDPDHALENASKIRFSEAFVEQIARTDRTILPPDECVRSWYDSSFMYQQGKIVKPKQGFSTERESCESGIHGFLTLAETRNFILWDYGILTSL